MSTETIEQRAERLVRQEINVCLSSLVSTLASQGGTGVTGNRDLSDLCEQAMELCTSLPDYEEPVRWHLANEMSLDELREYADDNQIEAVAFGTEAEFKKALIESICDHLESEPGDGWQEFADAHRIDPHESEVLEHWSVSTWLAAKLEAKGERVDRDFANMCVWGRTTSGQMISMDYVIQQIASEIVKG